jgi:hypothetical protein
MTAYRMCMLTRRIQILLDDRRYRRLQSEARARRASVGALVREAMIESLDREAERLGVPRQSLLKLWIADRLEALKRRTADVTRGRPSGRPLPIRQ